MFQTATFPAAVIPSEQLKTPSLTDEKNLVSEQIQIVRMSLKPLPNLFYSYLAC